MKPQSQIYSRYFTYIKPIGKLPIVRTYGATIFTLLVVVIFILFAIRPTVETILILQKKLEDSNSILEKITQKANDLTAGKQNYDNLDQTIKTKISDAIPDDVNLKTLVQTLEQSAIAHEASISALQIQPLVLEVKNGTRLGKSADISFTFNVEGTYPELLALLQDLRTSSRLISIETLSLSKVSEGLGLIMSITGKAYYIK